MWTWAWYWIERYGQFFRIALSHNNLVNYYKTNFSIEIIPGFIIENLGVVAIVVDSNNNAINSQFTAVNSFQDFN